MSTFPSATPVSTPVWKLPVLETQVAADPSFKRQTDLIGTFQDAKKALQIPAGAYAALAERCRQDEVFAGKLKTQQYFRFGGQGGAEDVHFVGFGPIADMTEEKVRQAGGLAWAKLLAEKSKTVAIHVDSFKAGPKKERFVRAFAEGILLSAYQFKKYHSQPEVAKEGKPEYKQPERLIFVTRERGFKAKLEAIVDSVRAEAEAVNITRDWSNEPSNIGTPEYYATEAQRLAKQYGLKCKVLNEADAAREKMGLFLSVGAGSEREGRIVVLEYTPKKAAKGMKTLALVGKGVTFDSGGISIKPSARMEEMKHDMTGAATLLGATLLAAQWKVPTRIVTILAFTENMPDAKATQPGNVIRARNGKTVEIINTDAEGRLVLADVLDYAHQFEPDAIINAATLTGAIVVALGKYACGIFGNDDRLVAAIQKAGDACGERLWQLPLFDEYFDDMKSDWADMKNSCNDASGGSIRGAIFLKQFIKKGMRWAHLDIAGTAYNVSHTSYLPKRGATGSHVRTIARFAADF